MDTPANPGFEVTWRQLAEYVWNNLDRVENLQAPYFEKIKLILEFCNRHRKCVGYVLSVIKRRPNPVVSDWDIISRNLPNTWSQNPIDIISPVTRKALNPLSRSIEDGYTQSDMERF